MVDDYTTRVDTVVAAMRRGDEDDIRTAMESMEDLVAGELLAELCVRVDEIVEGQNNTTLLAEAELPLPENPEILLSAVTDNDLEAMSDYADSDFSYLLASLLMLIAALEPSR